MKFSVLIRRSTFFLFTAFVGILLFCFPVNSQSAKQSTEHSNQAGLQYEIIDIGIVQKGDDASQAFRISQNGVAVGRSLRDGGSQAFVWTQGGGIVGLPNLSGFPYCVSISANDVGSSVGVCATTVFGSGRQPVIWTKSGVALLPLPLGETIGDANQINGAGVAVGSAGGGSLQRGVIYSGGTGNFITQTTTGGSFFVTAFGINDSGRVVGQGVDPKNAARNVGIVYDIGDDTAFEVTGLPGTNGALAFAVSNAGHIVGSAMMNQGSGTPFIWTESGGMVAIPLPDGTSQGSARGVNSNGWAVGTASSAFAIPFLYDGTNSFRLADLIPSGTGWDLSTNTSSSAMGISDDNVIVGSGVLNGNVHAFAMVPAGTQATVSISGRVLMANGAPIKNAVITITGGNLPGPVTARTGSFGHFIFPGLEPGLTYNLTVATRRYSFGVPTTIVTPNSDIDDVDFVANPN